MIERIPETIDPSQRWLVEYWAETLRVSQDGLLTIAEKAGPSVSRIKRELQSGFRIAVEDDNGNLRLIARISYEKGGFAVSVPYHPAKQGWLWEAPVRYDQRNYLMPANKGKSYTVNATVKLSMHMDGFIQFSTAGDKPIISGYNAELGKIKGAGLKAPQPVQVTSGPLFGTVSQGLSEFTLKRDKTAEVIKKSDMWHHPDFSNPSDTAYHLEAFMIPNALLDHSQLSEGRRTIRLSLPFMSQFKFPFELRVLELPGLPFFLGLILSRVRPDGEIHSGYKISGPGCGDSVANMRSLLAYYPRPSWVSDMDAVSLDYQPPAYT